MNAARPAPANRTVADVLLVAALAVAAVAVIGGGLVVEIAAVLAGHAGPPLTATAVVSGIGGWRRHPGNPRLGFPTPLRSSLPGPVGMYVAVVLALVVLTAVAVAVVRVLRWKPAAVRYAEGRWATGADLRALTVKAPVAGRVTIGTARRRLIAAEPRASLLVLGPTQSGKTTRLAVPALREWAGPVVATSVKRDLAEATSGRPGPLWIFDPTSPDSARWNPLDGCGEWRQSLRMAAWLVEAARPGRFEHHGGVDEYFDDLGAKLLAPMLHAAAVGGAAMGDVVTWLDRWDFAGVADLLAVDGMSVAASDAWAATGRRDPKQLSSVIGTAETLLKAFADPLVAAATSRSQFTAAQLLADSGTLHLVSPLHEQQRLQPVFTALTQMVVATAYEAAPLDPPLLLLLDEAANVAPLGALDKLASTGSGIGVQLLSVFQDVAQMEARYGPQRARTIISNHRGVLALSGLKDVGTLRLLSELAGEHEVDRVSRQWGSDGRASQTTAPERRRLAPVEQLRRMRRGEGVLLYGTAAPAHVTLRAAGR